MGAVRFSIDPVLVQTLKRALPIDVFVETGTFEGQTIQTVLPFFEEIYTCEVSEHLHAEVIKKFAGVNKVHPALGDSGCFLADLMPRLGNRSVLFWLDAHWCAAEGTAGQASECPLLDEIRAIHQLNEESVILIDDARLFLCPPPSPHEVSSWPALDDVLRALRLLSSQHRLMVLNDVVVFFPEKLQRAIAEFAHHHAIDWLSVMDRSRDYDKVLTDSRTKDIEIAGLARVCSERLKLIESQSDEIERMRKLLKSMVYRLGFCLVHPVTAAKELIRRSVPDKDTSE